MDALDFLGDLPGAAGSAGPPSESGGSLAFATPPSNKRRRGLLANIDKISQTSSGPSEAAPPGSKMSAGEGSPSAGQEDESCLGCGRGRNTCLSFFEPGGATEWCFAGGRGAWCRECYNTHRTCFASQPLALFATWIQGPAQREEFEETLIAYVSLKVEGCERVTAAKVRERVETLKFVFRFCGSSMRPCVVVPLSEWVQRPSPPPVLPSRLISILSGGKHVLGVLEPQRAPVQAGNIERPMGPFEALPCLYRHIACSEATEVALLGKVLSGTQGQSTETALVQFQPAASAAARVSESSRRDTLKVRLDVVQATCMTQLVCLSTDLWQHNLKETGFTSALTKLHPLISDAAALGREDIHGVAQDLVTGMTAGKFFARAYRDFKRVRGKSNRCATLQQHLEPFVAFCRKQAVPLSPTFELLWHQVLFAHDVQGAAGPEDPETTADFAVGAALQSRVSAGMFGCLEKLSSAGGPATQVISAQLWMGNLVRDGLATMLRRWLPDSEQTAAAVVSALRDLEELVQLLGRYGGPAEDMAPTRALSEALAQVMSLGTPDAKEPESRKLKVSLAALSSPDNALVDTAMRENGIMQDCLAQTHEALRRRASDDIADAKLRQSQEFLRDARLPHFEKETEDDPIFVRNFHLVLDGSMGEAIKESLEQLTEAFGLWSEFRRSEVSEAVTEWATSARKLLETANDGLWLRAGSALRLPTVVGLVEELAAGKALETQVLEDANAVVKELPTEDTFRQFCLKEFLPPFRRLCAAHPQQEGLQELLTFLERTLVPCMARRSSGMAALRRLLEALPLASATDMLKEWRDCGSTDSRETSRLQLVLTAFRAVKEFQEECEEGFWKPLTVDARIFDPSGLACFGRDASLRDEGTASKETPGEKAKTLDLPGVALGFQKAFGPETVQTLSSVLEGVLAGVFTEFSAQLELDGLVFDSGVPPNSAVSAIDGLVDTRRMPRSIQAGTAVAVAINRDESSLIESTSFLLSDLVESIGDPVVAMRSCTLLKEAAAVDADSAPTVKCISEVCFMCAHVSLAASCLVYLRHTFCGAAPQGMVEKNNLRPTVLRVLEALDVAANAVESALEGDDLSEAKESLLQWELSAAQALAWAKRVLQHKTHIHRYFIDALVKHATEITERIVQLTPCTAAYLSDTRYMKPQVKKHLLQWAGRDAYGKDAVALYTTLGSLATTHKKCNMSPSLQEDPVWGPPVLAAEAAYTQAKTTLLVIACANAIQQLEGHAARQAALQLLPKLDDVPAPMRAEVETLARDGGAPAKRSKTT